MLFRRNKEAAFSNYRLWESAGFVIAYAYSTTLCARMKLYVLLGNLIIGVIGYIIVEIRHRRKVNFAHSIKCTYLTFFLNQNSITFTKTNVCLFSPLPLNRNVDLKSRRPKKMQHVKLRQPRTKKSRRPMTRRTIWKMISRSHISKYISIILKSTTTKNRFNSKEGINEFFSYIIHCITYYYI